MHLVTHRVSQAESLLAWCKCDPRQMVSTKSSQPGWVTNLILCVTKSAKWHDNLGPPPHWLPVKVNSLLTVGFWAKAKSLTKRCLQTLEGCNSPLRKSNCCWPLVTTNWVHLFGNTWPTLGKNRTAVDHYFVTPKSSTSWWCIDNCADQTGVDPGSGVPMLGTEGLILCQKDSGSLALPNSIIRSGTVLNIGKPLL